MVKLTSMYHPSFAVEKVECEKNMSQRELQQLLRHLARRTPSPKTGQTHAQRLVDETLVRALAPNNLKSIVDSADKRGATVVRVDCIQIPVDRDFSRGLGSITFANFERDVFMPTVYQSATGFKTAKRETYTRSRQSHTVE